MAQILEHEMPYTVKQLAKLSGVSDRTLRYYDEIGLLKPSHVGENQYRYYKKEQLLKLQQILFFRELDFSLAKINEILESDDFNKIEALVSNRKSLLKKMENIKQLINTIDTTIAHLRGNIIMQDKDLYKGFDATKQKAYEEYLIQRGLSRDEIDESWRNVSKLSSTERKQLHEECLDITKSFAMAIDNKHAVDSETVQNLIRRHYDWVCHYWQPTKETYIALGKMYFEHNEFNDFYNQYHPEMVRFLSNAMTVFAEINLE